MSAKTEPTKRALLSMHYKDSSSSPRMDEFAVFLRESARCETGHERENLSVAISSERSGQKAAGLAAIVGVALAVMDDEVFFFAAGFPLKEGEHQQAGGEHKGRREQRHAGQEHQRLDGVDGVADVGVGATDDELGFFVGIDAHAPGFPHAFPAEEGGGKTGGEEEDANPGEDWVGF